MFDNFKLQFQTIIMVSITKNQKIYRLMEEANNMDINGMVWTNMV